MQLVAKRVDERRRRTPMLGPQLFKGLWPILDKDRKQAKDFHQVCVCVCVCVCVRVCARARAAQSSANPHMQPCTACRPVALLPLRVSLQRVQEWLKESGQLADLQGQSLAAFQRNPSGAKCVQGGAPRPARA
jgi:hypothetical protein